VTDQTSGSLRWGFVLMIVILVAHWLFIWRFTMEHGLERQSMALGAFGVVTLILTMGLLWPPTHVSMRVATKLAILCFLMTILVCDLLR
jgi:hypothetical protein